MCSSDLNAPTIDEVAIVMVGDQFLPRDYILHKQNAQLVRIAETHRCYDALRYPVIFWDGADCYHFNNKFKDPSTNKQTDKKRSEMHYYSYRLMIRQDEDNYILKCRQLFHKYIFVYLRINDAS